MLHLLGNPQRMTANSRHTRKEEKKKRRKEEKKKRVKSYHNAVDCSFTSSISAYDLI